VTSGDELLTVGCAVAGSAVVGFPLGAWLSLGDKLGRVLVNDIKLVGITLGMAEVGATVGIEMLGA